MKNPLLARLEKLEAQYKPVLVCAYRIGVVVKELPPDFVGERHIAILREGPDGHCEFEERPGPEPPGLRDNVPWVVLTEAEANA